MEKLKRKVAVLAAAEEALAAMFPERWGQMSPQKRDVMLLMWVASERTRRQIFGGASPSPSRLAPAKSKPKSQPSPGPRYEKNPVRAILLD